MLQLQFVQFVQLRQVAQTSSCMRGLFCDIRHIHMPSQNIPWAFLTPAQTAEALGVSKRTLNNWTREKKIPVIRPTVRTTRYNLSRVLEALEKFEIKEGRSEP